MLIGVSETTMRESIISRLKELGLSTHEAIAFMALLTHPKITASTLCKETNIPDSKIYYALDGLSKKGMIIVQQGNPNVYRGLSPKEAIANLKQKLTDRFNERIKEADVLAEQLSPIYDRAERPEELELAYIIRGQRNIINRMKALIEAARKEITIFISHPPMLEELQASLIKAKERRVKVNVGASRDVLKSFDPSDFGEVKLLLCPCSILISDMKTLLTVSSWTAEVAVLTQDQNLMRVCRDYYDNPKCCTKID